MSFLVQMSIIPKARLKLGTPYWVCLLYTPASPYLLATSNPKRPSGVTRPMGTDRLSRISKNELLHLLLLLETNETSQLIHHLIVRYSRAPNFFTPIWAGPWTNTSPHGPCHLIKSIARLYWARNLWKYSFMKYGSPVAHSPISSLKSHLTAEHTPLSGKCTYLPNGNQDIPPSCPSVGRAPITRIC